MPHATRTRLFAVARYRALGVAFLVMLVAAVALTYGIFNKSFTDYDEVTLETSKIGLQLPGRADVKIRGVLVGEVLDIDATGDGARMTLGLYPASRETIPADVEARILPKTLFGEKYVSLVVPESPSSEPIAAGDVIERSEVAIEVEKVLADMYPLLRTVQPAELNYTLTALATALEGRGEAIGENLVVLEDYLQRMNPKIPLLIEDLNKLSTVSETYRQVVPELANVLRNSVTTGNTFVEKEQKIQAFFSDVAGLSSTTRDFLEANGSNIIRLSKQGQAQLPLFARYAPEYPCLLNGIVGLIPRSSESFRDFTLHIQLEVLPNQPRGYDPRDNPVYADRRGPIPTDRCQRAIRGEFDQNNLPPDSYVPRLQDGVDYPVGKERTAPMIDMTSGFAGTAAESAIVDGLTGPALGVSADSVPDVASLLFAPLARGTTVTVR